MDSPYFNNEDFKLYLGDSLELIKKLPMSFDMVFSDPPYFLSNGGSTIQSGEIVSVNKGEWDKLQDLSIDEFNHRWIKEVREKMNKNGTIWISGTMHNIYSIYKALLDLNFKVLNTITWEKTNPPPNFTTKVFTHSTEIVIWARKEHKFTHQYNYELMKKINLGKQMKDVWRLPAIAPWEKKFGKHPTQKPLSLLTRIILASTKEGDIILDPFTGSSSTGIAANLLNRNFVGIDSNEDFLNLSIKRYDQIQNKETAMVIRAKIQDLASLAKNSLF
jgi:site-specific DNA-methyltransferase (adenine-specific)